MDDLKLTAARLLNSHLKVHIYRATELPGCGEASLPSIHLELEETVLEGVTQEWSRFPSEGKVEALTEALPRSSNVIRHLFSEFLDEGWVSRQIQEFTDSFDASTLV